MMTDVIGEIIHWSVKQCALMRDRIEMMEYGILHTHENIKPDVSQETTEKTILEYMDEIKEFDRLLSEYKRFGNDIGNN